MGGNHKPQPSIFFRKLLKKEKLDLTDCPEDYEDWVLNEGGENSGLELVQQVTELLNDRKNRDRNSICVMYLTAMKNWYLSLGEISRLEKEIEKLNETVKKLEVQIKILKGD